ncbi:hypothetical protein S40288_11339 [Stachybotrys chartarum IBT 40288]|nr:hypothetical protein S40288_11339 [Stachybotrys chartarum IBT 40288]
MSCCRLASPRPQPSPIPDLRPSLSESAKIMAAQEAWERRHGTSTGSPAAEGASSSDEPADVPVVPRSTAAHISKNPPFPGPSGPLSGARGVAGENSNLLRAAQTPVPLPPYQQPLQSATLNNHLETPPSAAAASSNEPLRSVERTKQRERASKDAGRGAETVTLHLASSAALAPLSLHRRLMASAGWRARKARGAESPRSSSGDGPPDPEVGAMGTDTAIIPYMHKLIRFSEMPLSGDSPRRAERLGEVLGSWGSACAVAHMTGEESTDPEARCTADCYPTSRLFGECIEPPSQAGNDSTERPRRRSTPRSTHRARRGRPERRTTSPGGRGESARGKHASDAYFPRGALPTRLDDVAAFAIRWWAHALACGGINRWRAAIATGFIAPLLLFSLLSSQHHLPLLHFFAHLACRRAQRPRGLDIAGEHLAGIVDCPLLSLSSTSPPAQGSRGLDIAGERLACGVPDRRQSSPALEKCRHCDGHSNMGSKTGMHAQEGRCFFPGIPRPTQTRRWRFSNGSTSQNCTDSNARPRRSTGLGWKNLDKDSHWEEKTIRLPGVEEYFDQLDKSEYFDRRLMEAWVQLLKMNADHDFKAWEKVRGLLDYPGGPSNYKRRSPSLASSAAEPDRMENNPPPVPPSQHGVDTSIDDPDDGPGLAQPILTTPAPGPRRRTHNPSNRGTGTPRGRLNVSPATTAKAETSPMNSDPGQLGRRHNPQGCLRSTGLAWKQPATTSGLQRSCVAPYVAGNIAAKICKALRASHVRASPVRRAVCESPVEPGAMEIDRGVDEASECFEQGLGRESAAQEQNGPGIRWMIFA